MILQDYPKIPDFLTSFEELEQNEKEKTDALARREKQTSVSTIQENGIIKTSNALDNLKVTDLAKSLPTYSEGDPEYDGPNFGGILGKKGDIKGGIMSGLGSIQSVATDLATTSGSDEESLMKGVNNTFSLAQTGFQLGGLWGAAGGAAAGIVLGAVDMFGDRKKRSEKAFNDAITDNQRKSETRQRNWDLDKSQRSIEALKSMYKNDLNYIDTSQYG